LLEIEIFKEHEAMKNNAIGAQCKGLK